MKLNLFKSRNFCHKFQCFAFIITMIACRYEQFDIEMEPALEIDPARLKKSLVEKARTDSAAFAYLFRLHYDEIFRYCARRLFDRAAAEDVTSAVFLKMVGNFSRFRGSLRAFRGWLYKIATNEVNSYLRKSFRHQKMLSDAAQISSAGGNNAGDENTRKLAMLKAALFSLKPKYQAVIALRFFQEMNPSEIAEALGRDAGTVRSQLSRGLKMLRQALEARERKSGDV